MGAILQFAETLADGQDWTASERAQLRDVGAQLDGVDVVFGKTEAGDPWCVVTDDGGEVLLHVARIDGDFVVHATRNDEVVQDDNLWGAAKRLLGDVLKERRGVLLAFPPEALGQTAVLAFLFAAAMRGEFDHWIPISSRELPPAAGADGHGADLSEALPPPADPAGEAGRARQADDAAPARGGDIKEAARAGAPDAQAPAHGDGGAAQVRGDDAPAPDRAPAPAQAAALPPAPARPDPGANRGGSQTEVASFNTGSDGGAQTAGTGAAAEPAPEAPLSEFVEGGDGDDRIAMSGNVAAAGGRGADTFVLALPTAVHEGPVLLGFVADFDSAEGDRLELTGRAVMVVDRTETDLLSAVRTRPGAVSSTGVTAGTGPATPLITDAVPMLTGRHIGYDVDGDGKEDAYVLVTSSGGTWFTSVRPAGGNAGAAIGSTAAPGLATGFGGLEIHAPIGITAEPLAGSEGKDFLF